MTSELRDIEIDAVMAMWDAPAMTPPPRRKVGIRGRGTPVDDTGPTSLRGDYGVLRIDQPTQRQALCLAARHAPAATLVGWAQGDDHWLASIAQRELEHRQEAAS